MMVGIDLKYASDDVFAMEEFGTPTILLNARFFASEESLES